MSKALRSARPAHAERHFAGSRLLRDVVIGMSDGLTVPFALAAGLSGAVSSSSVVVVAGLAELVAGAISMGLGGFLAGRTEADHYASERRREVVEIKEMPGEEAAEVATVLRRYGLTPAESAPIVEALKKRPEAWVDFMMRFELGLEEPEPGAAWKSAATIGGAYAAGGLLPLAPYFVVAVARDAMAWSSVVALVALLVFGFVKARFTGGKPLLGALQAAFIGGLAAAAAFALAHAVSG